MMRCANRLPELHAAIWLLQTLRLFCEFFPESLSWSALRKEGRTMRGGLTMLRAVEDVINMNHNKSVSMPTEVVYGTLGSMVHLPVLPFEKACQCGNFALASTIVNRSLKCYGLQSHNTEDSIGQLEGDET